MEIRSPSGNHVLDRDTKEFIPVNNVTTTSTITTSTTTSKNNFGEQLYPLIYAQQPTLAGKITGMLLDGLSTMELQNVLDSSEILWNQVEEALECLERHNSCEDLLEKAVFQRCEISFKKKVLPSLDYLASKLVHTETRHHYSRRIWRRIFTFLVPEHHHLLNLRCMCHLFHSSLPLPPLHVLFPHPKYLSLNDLFERLHHIHSSNKEVEGGGGSGSGGVLPTHIFLRNGSHRSASSNIGQDNCYIRGFPITIVGESSTYTIITRGGFYIDGGNTNPTATTDSTEEGMMPIVVIQNLKILSPCYDGINNYGGLAVKVDNVSIVNAGHSGICIQMGSKCDLINIRVSSAGINGVYVGRNSRITMQGKNTHIVVGKSTLNLPYGVKAGGHSAAGRHPNVGHGEFGTIFLIHPLTKKNVAHGHLIKEFNCNGPGAICECETMDDCKTIEIKSNIEEHRLLKIKYKISDHYGQ